MQEKVRSHAQKESAVPPPTPPGEAKKPKRGAEGGRGETDRQTDRAEMRADPLPGTKGFSLEMVGRDKGSEKRGRHFFPFKLIFNGKAYWTETWTRVT